MKDPGENVTRELDVPKLEALVETMYLAAFADGEFSEIERAHFGRSVDRLTEGRLSPTQFEEVLLRLQERLQESGRQGCIESIRARLTEPQLRWLAVLLAADITAADGLILASEREVLLELAAALDIDAGEAEELVEGFEVR
jgi:tellurite resistance protein